MAENPRVQKQPDPIDQLPSISEPMPRSKTRLFSFKIPSSCRAYETDPGVIELRELTADEQVEAGKIGRGDRLKSGFELAKASVYSANGRVVNRSNFEIEVLWASWSPKVRQLVSLGYTKIHNTDDSEDDDFLGSMLPK